MTSRCSLNEIDGIVINEIKTVADARGSLGKFHPSARFANSSDSIAFSVNPNVGIIRGLHFQIEPFAEEKMITCIQGAVFDVVVDLRSSSKTFGMWASTELSMKNALMLYLPKGIAHGFQTLEPDSIVLYSLSAPYSSDFAYAINPFGEPGIDWPVKVHTISERDVNGISLSTACNKYADSLKGI
jgi:dTDP-4-dehydrorhamnose 3,5-epimerase